MLCEMQSVSSRIWTRVAVSISYDDNHYTKSTSYIKEINNKSKFCHVLEIWSTIWQHWVLLLKSWRCQNTLEYKMSISPDTFRVLLIRFTAMAWSTASESTVFCLPDLTLSSKFLQVNDHNTVINFAFSYRARNIPRRYGPFGTRKT